MMLLARRWCRKTSFPEPGIKSILQKLLVVGCYAPSHGKRIGNGRVVGDHRTAATTGTTQAERRQVSRAGSSGPDRHHLRAQERHTLGDASQGDGLREREHVLAAPARAGGGWGVARAAPGLARPAGKGRRDRLGASLARFGERGGQKGGEKVGKNPSDRGKPGSKRHVVSDRRGVPLAVALTAANVHDSKVFEELLDGIKPIKRPGRGRPRKRPEKLHADKGYDFPRCRKALRECGIKSRIARRGKDTSERLGKHPLARQR
jgi:transposase